MELRKATPQDAWIISMIHARSWKSAYKGIVSQKYLDALREDFWVSAFEDWLRRGKVAVRLLYVEGTPIGSIAYGEARDKAYSGWGEIVSLYMMPDCFGRGLGGALMNAALANLREKGYPSAYLWVLEKNGRARRFYEKHGFFANGDVSRSEIAGEPVTDLRYVRKLL